MKCEEEVDGETGVRRGRDKVARKGTRLFMSETWGMEWEAGL